MSHLTFSILAFFTNFFRIKIDLSGNTVWPQVEWDFFCDFQTLCYSKTSRLIFLLLDQFSVPLVLVKILETSLIYKNSTAVFWYALDFWFILALPKIHSSWCCFEFRIPSFLHLMVVHVGEVQGPPECKLFSSLGTTWWQK